MKKTNEQKGITLVALVVTIIIMLILAGISISELSGQGLFSKAIAAKEKAKIAELEEILKTQLYVSTIENNGTIDIEKYINYLENNDEYKDIAIEKESEVEYYATMEEGYIFLIEETEEGKINIVYSGKAGSLLPRIKEIKVINKTTNSIKVEVISRFSDGATYKYYIKGQDEEYGNAKTEISDIVYEFTELTQNKKYNIKVEVITKEGSTEKEIEVSLGAIKEVGLGSFSPATWINENVTVTLPIEEGYTTRYTTDGSIPTISGTQYTAPFTVSSNKIIMYCYSDGTNVSNYGVLEVNNIDKVNPTVGTGLNNTEKTTNSMTMNFNVIDEDSGISKITWYYKLEAETQFISESEINENAPINGDKTGITTEQNKTKTFSDLINGKYNIYVEIYDVAGNITRMPETGTVDVELNTVTQASGATISPSTYTNGNVTVTLPTAPSGFTTRYTTDGSVPTTSSTQYTAPFTVSSNQTINYCYSDGINVGQYGTQEVNNIDKTAPVIGTVSSTTTSVTVNATDTGSGIVGIKVTTTNTAPTSFDSITSTNTLTNKTISGLAQNTTYYVWVKDQAGNVSVSKEIKTQIQYVTSISLNQTSASLNVGSKLTLTTTVSPSNANNRNVTWSSSNTSVATVSNGVVTAKTAGTATITATAQDGSGKSASCTITVIVPSSVAPTTATTHTATAITYSWAELSTIAKMISNNSAITNDTLEINVTLNGTTKTLGVGDTATVDSKTVRILGFNHDTLTTSTAYGTTTATGKAGITFEYVDYLITAAMNSSNTNTGGWGATALRTTLNGTTYNSLSIKSYIKQVQKEYIQTYNSASSKTYSSDYLWLLSCGEIWDNGYNGGVTRGYAIATEGSQYKYYKSKLGSTSYSSGTDVTKKPIGSYADWWWLRSPFYTNYKYGDPFCGVYSSGNCSYGAASWGPYGVAPGFSI